MHKPSVASVTKQEYREIIEDPFLKVCNFPSVAWFEGFGFERTQINEDKYRENYPQEMPKGANLALRIGDAPEELNKVVVEPKKVEEPVQVPQETPTAPEVSQPELTKKEICEELKKAGKVEGKDFNKRSNRDALLKLLQTL